MTAKPLIIQKLSTGLAIQPKALHERMQSAPFATLLMITDILKCGFLLRRTALCLRQGLQPDRDHRMIADSKLGGPHMSKMEIFAPLDGSAFASVPQRLKAALQASKTTLFSQDRDLRYTWVLNSILGMHPAQIIGKTDRELMQRSVDALVLEVIKHRVMENGEPERNEVLIRQNDVDYYYDVTVEPLRPADADRIIGVVGSARDISHFRQMPVTLSKSEQRFRAAQEASPIPTIILQSIRNVTRRIVDFEYTYANPAAQRILKRTAADMVGRRISETGSDFRIDAKTIFDQLVRVVETGEPADDYLDYKADGVSARFHNMTAKLDDGVIICWTETGQRAA